MFDLDAETLAAIENLSSDSEVIREAAERTLIRKMALRLSCFARSRYSLITADAAVDAVVKGIKEFAACARKRDFDPKQPVRLLVRIVKFRVIDAIRKETHCKNWIQVSPTKNETILKNLALDLDATSAADEAECAEFYEALRESCFDMTSRQRQVARLMIEHSVGIPFISAADVRDLSLLSASKAEWLTYPAARSARNEVLKRFDKVCIRFGMRIA